MDIEDLHDELSDGVRQRVTDNLVQSRYKTARPKAEYVPPIAVSSDIPEKYKIFVQTWGCTHNTSDSEYMSGLLARYGYKVTLGGTQIFDTDNSSTSDPSTSLTEEDGGDGDGASKKCDCGEEEEKQCCGKNSEKFIEPESELCSEKASQDRDVIARDKAHLWVLNSCTVKGPAEDHFRNVVEAGRKAGKYLVVAGCVPQSRPSADYLKGVSVIGVQQIDRIVEVVEETLHGNTVRFLEKKWAPLTSSGNSIEPRRRLAGAELDLPKIRRNRFIEILAISTGCLNACTYCKTKQARGVLASYPIEQLLERAHQAFLGGVKELWLTSEDLGAYGRDLPRSTSVVSCSTMADRFPDCLTLSDLLSGLVRIIPPGCMLRLGMTNPPYIMEQLDQIADVLAHPRVYSFIHVPVQSGSDAVLDVMQREYTVEEFSHVVDYLQEHVPELPLSPDLEFGAPNGSSRLTVATDIICGFPNETDDDFEQTVQLVERFQFPVLYINQFFARPGTPAANMPRKATTAEVKRRTRRLHDLFRTYQPYAGREGALVRVLVTEVSHDSRFWVGHTKAYEQVLVPKDPSVLGSIILVRITECDKFFMRSEIVNSGPFDSLVFASSDCSPFDLPHLPKLDVNSSTFEPSYHRRNDAPGKAPVFIKGILHIGLIILLFYLVTKLCECRGYIDLGSMVRLVFR